MVDVITSIEINAPADKVAAFACNPDNAPDWYVNIQSVVWKTPRPLQVGSRLAFVARFLGRDMAYTYEVVELSADKFVMRTAEGPFPMETAYAFEAISTGVTRMTLRNRGVPSGFSKLFSPFMRLMMKRANNKDLEKIKSLLEERQ